MSGEADEGGVLSRRLGIFMFALWGAEEGVGKRMWGAVRSSSDEKGQPSEVVARKLAGPDHVSGCP